MTTDNSTIWEAIALNRDQTEANRKSEIEKADAYWNEKTPDFGP